MGTSETRQKSFATSLICLIIASALWGSTFIFAKILIEYMTVSYVLFFRSIITAVILYFLFIKTIKLELLKSIQSLIMWSFSILGFLALYLQTLSLKYTSASNSAFITAFFVVVVPIIERFYYKRIIKLQFYIAVAIAIIGLYCISYGFSLPDKLNLGDSLALISAVLYGFYIVFLEKLVSRFSEGTIMFFSFALWVFLSLFTVIFEKGLSHSPTLNIISVSNLFAIAVLGSVIPYLLMAKGQRVVSAQLASLVYNLEPIFATLLAFICLGETFTIAKVTGCIIIFAALILGSTSK